MRAFAPFLSRTGRLRRWPFTTHVVALALGYFALVWLGAAFFALLSGVRPGELLPASGMGTRPWPALAAVWYGAMSVGFVALATNLFLNRLNDTSLPRACAAMVWFTFALGLVSCADTAIALRSGTEPNEFYWAPVWGLVATLLSFPKSRPADKSPQEKPMSTINRDASSASNETEVENDDGESWIANATRRIQDLAGEPQVQPAAQTRAPAPVARSRASAPAFGKRRSLASGA